MAERACELSSADGAVILLAPEPGGALRLAAASSLTPEEAQRISIGNGGPLVGEVLAGGGPIVAAVGIHQGTHLIGFGPAVGVPLRSEDASPR